jgi:hypothetical protein
LILKTILSFSGGAIYIVGLATALKTLKQNGINLLSNVTALGGTSAGAIVAGLIAIGKDEYEIYEIIDEQVSKSMVKWPIYKRPFQASILDHGPVERLLKKHFNGIGINETNIPLYIVSVATNRIKKSKVFDNANNIPLWKCVRASLSASPYYTPFLINGIEYLDGGFGRNNPSEAVLNGAYRDLSINPRDIRCIHFATGGLRKGQRQGSMGYLKTGKWFINNFISIGEDFTDYSMRCRLDGDINRYWTFEPIDDVNASFFDTNKIAQIKKMWKEYTLQNINSFDLWLNNVK